MARRLLVLGMRERQNTCLNINIFNFTPPVWEAVWSTIKFVSKSYLMTDVEAAIYKKSKIRLIWFTVFSN